MIGSAVHLSFNDFLLNLAPVTPVILLVTLFIIYLIWGRHMAAEDAARQRVMSFQEREAITDVTLLKQSLVVFALVITGFVLAQPLHLEPASVAMGGAALLLLLTNIGTHPDDQAHHVHRSFSEVEWVTIFFFVGLFVLVHGIEQAGLLGILSNKVLEYTGGNITYTAMTILWVSAVFSAIVDNIPFVATMIPIIKDMAPAFGGAENLMPLWWSLALGACLGGNGSLIGASANLIVAGYAERAGHRIRFISFMLLAFPMMFLSILVSSFYIYYRYL
jgi:Na+/H+ antiporter NhaD/arsenite permease-like protein